MPYPRNMIEFNRSERGRKLLSELCRSTWTGRRHSPETLLKMKAAAKRRYSDPRQLARLIAQGKNTRLSGSPRRKLSPEERRVRSSLKWFIHGSLRRCLGNKSPQRAIEILGYDHTQLRTYLESLFLPGMTWENHSRFGWHIDHIKPISKFPAGTSARVINALGNLRPMWWRDNLDKRMADGSSTVGIERQRLRRKSH